MNKALVIIGGNLVKDLETGVWRSTNKTEGDNFGALGDRYRVLAGAYLYREDPSQTVITLGGKGQLAVFPDAPNISEAIKSELVDLGVPGDKIFCETNSGNTYQQLVELLKIASEMKFDRVTLVTNRYHIPRVGALMEKIDVLRALVASGGLQVLSAEDVVIGHDGSVKYVVDEAYASDGIKKRIQQEEEGARQIKEGTYILK